MLSTLKDDITVRNTFDRASFILGKDLWSLCSSESLDQTEIAQPVLLTAGVALHRTIGCPAGIMTGHSLGEFIALTCAGSIDFEDALHLISYRGSLMQNLNTQGCMAMIHGLDYETVLEICGSSVDVATINSPLRISVAGVQSDVIRVVEVARERGANWADVWEDALPFHSRLLKPIEDEFQNAINNIHIELPAWSSVVSNVSGEIYTGVGDIKTNLVKHLTSTVQWEKCINTIRQQKVSEYIEIGPRPLIAKLVLENDPTAKVISIHDKETIDKYCFERNL